MMAQQKSCLLQHLRKFPLLLMLRDLSYQSVLSTSIIVWVRSANKHNKTNNADSVHQTASHPSQLVVENQQKEFLQICGIPSSKHCSLAYIAEHCMPKQFHPINANLMNCRITPPIPCILLIRRFYTFSICVYFYT